MTLTSRFTSGFQPWMAATGGAVVVVAAVGLLALRAPAEATVPDSSERMQVEVVAPIEPVVDPGGVMDVGELVDGYTHVAIQPQAEGPDVYDPVYQTAWIEPLPPVPAPRVWRSDGATVSPTQPQPEVETTRSGGMFGFDDPQPDYAAERRAREERLDRIQAEQAARGRAGAVAASPGLDRDSAFY